MSTSRHPDYMLTEEVADLFKVTRRTVMHWADDGKLPAVRTLGGHRRFPRAETEAIAAGQCRTSGGEEGVA